MRVSFLEEDILTEEFCGSEQSLISQWSSEYGMSEYSNAVNFYQSTAVKDGYYVFKKDVEKSVGNVLQKFYI